MLDGGKGGGRDQSQGYGYDDGHAVLGQLRYAGAGRHTQEGDEGDGVAHEETPTAAGDREISASGCEQDEVSGPATPGEPHQ